MWTRPLSVFLTSRNPLLLYCTVRVVQTLMSALAPRPVSLDGILQNIRSLERGMEMTKKEFLVQDDSSVLKEFIKTNSEVLESLVKDSKTAQV